MANIEKRINSKGQVTSYRIRVYKGVTGDGRRMKPYIKYWTPEPGMTARQIEKEVNRIAVLFEEEIKAGNEVVNQNIKFKDFIPQYMEITKVRMSPLTLQFYDRIIDRLLIPYFGNKRLQDIKTAHVQGFINHLMELDPEHSSATNNTDKLSPSTVRRYLTVLQSIFKQAVKLEIIANNPAKGDKLTIPRVVNPKIEIFTKAEAAEMLKCLQEEDLMFQTFIQLAIITGARRGELAALKFSDFDFDKCQLTISRAAIKLKDQEISIKPPKDYEIRTVTVNRHCIQLVKMLQQQHQEDKQRLGDRWKGDDWVFTQWNGEIMNPQTPTKQFRQFLKRHGLKHRKLHSLRHTSATLLLYGGVNIRQVQARLGHSEIETTQKYLHYLSDADAEAAIILTNMIEEDESHHIDIDMAL